MDLQRIELMFVPEILARGQAYYENGKVVSLTQISETNWQAEVRGSELYIVDLVINNVGIITYMDCDCPYEGRCKHVAATLYAINQLHTHQKPKKVKAKPSIKQLLQPHTKEQLIELIVQLSKKHRAVKQELELQLAPKKNELAAASDTIMHYMTVAQDRHGFIKWGQTSTAVQGIELVHERIEALMEEEQIELAIQLSLLCVYRGMEMMQYGDDSNGELSGAVESSIELLQRATSDGEPYLNDKQKENVLCQIGDAVFSEELQDWAEWQLDLLRACVPLCEEAARNQQLVVMMETLERKHVEGWTSKYVKEQLQSLRNALYTTKLTDEQALAHLMAHPADDELRERLIYTALQSNDYALILQLAEQGDPHMYRPFLFMAHQQLGHVQEARVLGEELLLAGNLKYYEQLKAMYEPAQWSVKREELLNKLEKTSRYIYESIIVEEQLTERILAFCQKNTAAIRQHYKYLVGTYDQEVEHLFVQEIVKAASLATNRTHYSSVCQLIETMQKAGYQARAVEMIATLKQQNKRRPAFLDELNHIS